MWINAKRNESLVTFQACTVSDLLARDLMIRDVTQVAEYQRTVHAENKSSGGVPLNIVSHVEAVLNEADLHN